MWSNPNPNPNLDPSPNPNQVRLPVRVPVMNDQLTIKVSDYDHGGYDDLVADCIFSLNEIVSKRTLPPRWVCLALTLFLAPEP